LHTRRVNVLVRNAATHMHGLAEAVRLEVRPRQQQVQTQLFEVAAQLVLQIRAQNLSREESGRLSTDGCWPWNALIY